MRVRYDASGSAAYDLEKFEGKPRVRVRRPNLVVTGPNAKARAIAKAKARAAMLLKVAAILTVAVAIVVTMLYSRAKLTELDQMVDAQTKKLSEEISRNSRLNAELDAKVSLRNVEEYATQTLGMVAVDKNQVTYVDLSEGDKIELTSESPKLTLLDRIDLAIGNVKERMEQD